MSIAEQEHKPIALTPNCKKPADRDDWQTTSALFTWLHSRFDFNIDAAACKESALLTQYLSKEEDTLSIFRPNPNWRVFCNPPYSLVKEFTEHLWLWWYNYGVPSVILSPVRSDRIWWNHFRTTPGVRTEFYTGRIHFSNAGKGAFMYNMNFIFGYPEVEHEDPIDASIFNVGCRGGAKR